MPNSSLNWLHIISLICHLLATVVWIGGLLIMTFLLLPEVRAMLEKQQDSERRLLFSLLDRLRKRFYPIANLSLGVLLVTGLYQMAQSPFYEGVMQFNNDWSRAILIKHIAVIGMVGVGAVMQFGLIPALERSILLMSRGKPAPEIEALRRRERRLTVLNAVLGVLVLVCTAVASSL